VLAASTPIGDLRDPCHSAPAVDILTLAHWPFAAFV